MPVSANNFTGKLRTELRPILQLAIDRFRLGAMSIHGPVHWLKVYQNAMALCDQTPGCDRIVAQHFALLHDCARQGESHDPQHGQRAADYIEQLATTGQIAMSPATLRILAEACIHHDRGKTSLDPTIGVCWDADRLDLPRVGIKVDSTYLSTDAAVRLCRNHI